MTILGQFHHGSYPPGRSAWGWWLAPVAVGAACFVLGHLVAGQPLMAVVGTLAGLAVVVAATQPDLIAQLYLIALGLLLFGYAFFGRAFAHVGVPPVFVGEAVLGLGLLTLLTNARRWAAFQSPIAWAYLLFATWGMARAIPFLPIYGLDVLRDSVTWGYGIFALLVPAVVFRVNRIRGILTYYARWMPVLLLWIPVGLIGDQLFRHLLPQAPGGGEPMTLVKPGEAGVHLAGAATFLLLGLHRAPGVRARRGLLGAEWFLGPLCGLAFIVIGVLGRGGAVAAFMGIGLVLVIRPLVALPKALLVGATGVVAVLVLLATNFTIELGRRDLSAYQLGSNLLSIVGDAPADEQRLEDTRDWRLRWWTHIIDYTIYGPYFWTGKGFGINLATDDGVPVRKDAELRSPHSGHLSVLARMGVPGEVLWIVLQVTFGLSMLAGYLRAHRSGRELLARLELWVLAYWLASLTEISFAVYLESPPGGIWFWTIVGFGLSLLLTQRQLEAEPGTTAPASTRLREAAARP
jgi:hypothetical protein